VKHAIVSPQELTRLQILRRYLQGYIELLRVYVPLVSSELIFDLDETGLSDWEERNLKPIPMSAECENRQLHYSVDRRIRHQMLICGISASGDAYCPLLLSTNLGMLAVFDRAVWENPDLHSGSSTPCA
jgi:hypothetical protein